MPIYNKVCPGFLTNILYRFSFACEINFSSLEFFLQYHSKLTSYFGIRPKRLRHSSISLGVSIVRKMCSQ